MKHLKLYDKYSVENKHAVIMLGDYIKLSAQMSRNMYVDRLYFASSVKEISIYIGNIFCGSVRIDERGFNTIRDSYSIQPEIKNKYVKKLTNKLKEYLFICHDQMKKSNPDYGTYDVENDDSYGNQGNINLYVHDFFDYVENDFDNSNSNIVNDIKNDVETVKYMLDAEKYNL